MTYYTDDIMEDRLDMGVTTLDLDLLASIASGGLGHWVEDQNGKQRYVKDDDCVGTFFTFLSLFGGAYSSSSSMEPRFGRQII